MYKKKQKKPFAYLNGFFLKFIFLTNCSNAVQTHTDIERALPGAVH